MGHVGLVSLFLSTVGKMCSWKASPCVFQCWVLQQCRETVVELVYLTPCTVGWQLPHLTFQASFQGRMDWELTWSRCLIQCPKFRSHSAVLYQSPATPQVFSNIICKLTVLTFPFITVSNFWKILQNKLKYSHFLKFLIVMSWYA